MSDTVETNPVHSEVPALGANKSPDPQWPRLNDRIFFAFVVLAMETLVLIGHRPITIHRWEVLGVAAVITSVLLGKRNKWYWFFFGLGLGIFIGALV